MNAKELSDSLFKVLAIEPKIPMCIWGPPGIGKSMILHQVAEVLELEVIDLRLAQIPPSDLRGIPQIVDGKTHYARPEFLRQTGKGILFLDELPEFKRSALEVLRQPLEDGKVTISRSAGKVTLPCRFMLVAAMNPCPCGYLGDNHNSCRCSIPQIHRYRSKISGPLMDRIDMHIETPAVRIEELQTSAVGEDSLSIRRRVENCRNIP